MSIKSLRRRLDEICLDFARFVPQAKTGVHAESWIKNDINIIKQQLEYGLIDAEEAERMIEKEERKLSPDYTEEVGASETLDQYLERHMKAND